MLTKNIPWNIGSGNIKITYMGSGNGSLLIESDTENDSFEERSQVITLQTTKGTPLQVKSLTVYQAPKTIPVGTIYNYDYTGTVQQVTLPKGKYKLQCWGAQGGNVTGSYSAIGSKGGYSEGIISLTKPTTFYIFVGGKGSDVSTSNTSGTVNGGWNGGGGASRKASYNSGNTYGESFPRAGGGATDIALVSSDMSYSNYRNNRSNDSLLSRFIVAGGGAGASARYTEETTTSTTTREDYIGNYSRHTQDTSSSGNYISYFSYSFQSGTTYKIIINGSYSSANLWNSSYTKRQSVSSGQSFTCSADYGILEVKTGASTLIDSVDIYEIITDTTTSTDTSSGKSNASQQGGGTQGRGTSPGTQTSGGGSFGLGANQTTTNYRYASGAGGGGWYGGGSSYSDSSTSNINSSGGGSGFVNTAANAGSRPSGYTGLQLDSGETKAGNVSFPSTGGGTETGHSGNGYARITKLE